jgi:ADP-ribose pyrophosphatase
VVTEQVRTPAREQAQRWTVVHRKAAVAVAPMTSDGRLVLIRQERIPIRAAIWEVPAGQIDDSGQPDPEAIEAVGLREMQEETGYQLGPAGEIIPLGLFFSSPGFTDEHAYFFLARNVEPAETGYAHQESESILDCRSFSAEEISRMIADDEIRDANTLSICAKLAVRGDLVLRA